MGTETMICFSGLRRTLYRPGSRLRSLAAWSKRSIIASNGFSSARKVSLSGRMSTRGSVARAVSLMGSWSRSLGSKTAGHHGQRIQRLHDRLAVVLPPDGQDRHQRLARVGRPPVAQFHSILLRDYNIIGRGLGPHQPREVGLVVGVMVLVRHELHARSLGPDLHGI